MYIPLISPYIHCCNHTMYFLSSTHISGLLHTFFCNFFYDSSLCLLQPHKNSKQRNTVWHFDNSDDHTNRNEPSPLSIATHILDAVQLQQENLPNSFITPIQRDAEQVLFTMRGNGSLGYQSHNTIHYPSHHHNDDYKSSEKEFLEVYSGEESCGHRSQETRHYTSINHGSRGSRSSMISQSDSPNHGGYVDIGGSRC